MSATKITSFKDGSLHVQFRSVRSALEYISAIGLTVSRGKIAGAGHTGFYQQIKKQTVVVVIYPPKESLDA